jgi:uncharacterized protein
MAPSELEIEAIFEDSSPEEAMRLLSPLAEGGHPVAQFYVGELHGLGDGVPRDEAAALHWYLKSAASGYARAHHYIGVCYKIGMGCEPDAALARRHFEAASRLGFTVPRK